MAAEIAVIEIQDVASVVVSVVLNFALHEDGLEWLI
jgi:hypothetical protein